MALCGVSPSLELKLLERGPWALSSLLEAIRMPSGDGLLQAKRVFGAMRSHRTLILAQGRMFLDCDPGARGLSWLSMG